MLICPLFSSFSLVWNGVCLSKMSSPWNICVALASDPKAFDVIEYPAYIFYAFNYISYYSTINIQMKKINGSLNMEFLLCLFLLTIMYL